MIDPTKIRIDTAGRTTLTSVLRALRELYTFTEGDQYIVLQKALQIATALSGTPASSTLYKAVTGIGFGLPMNAASAIPSLIAYLTAAQGGIAAGAAEGWHEIGAASEPAFSANIASEGGANATCAFRKLPTGMVVLKGTARLSGGATSGTYTLPAGYRPAATLLWPSIVQAGTVGQVAITSAGVVTLSGLINGAVAQNVSFYAEA